MGWPLCWAGTKGVGASLFDHHPRAHPGLAAERDEGDGRKRIASEFAAATAEARAQLLAACSYSGVRDSDPGDGDPELVQSPALGWESRKAACVCSRKDHQLVIVGPGTTSRVRNHARESPSYSQKHL